MIKFSKDHEWVQIDGNIGLVGITDYAQAALGDVVYVELPDVGRTLQQGEAAAVVESVKAASDVYTPVSGTVNEINTSLLTSPQTVNESPRGEGWFFRITLSMPIELEELMDEKQYKEFLNTLGH